MEYCCNVNTQTAVQALKAYNTQRKLLYQCVSSLPKISFAKYYVAGVYIYTKVLGSLSYHDNDRVKDDWK